MEENEGPNQIEFTKGLGADIEVGLIIEGG